MKKVNFIYIYYNRVYIFFEMGQLIVANSEWDNSESYAESGLSFAKPWYDFSLKALYFVL